jgi:F-type H+-transporting ATPase subunit alpha
MDKVPVNKVREFEKDFTEVMNASHRAVLDNLRAGKFEDSDVATIKQVAADLASKY